MNLKIREAQINKIPYMLIIGDKELANNTVSVRLRTGEDLGSLVVNQFKDRIRTIIMTKENQKL